ncbi:uncharacterized protein LOC114523069 [Dendronephthya gigantea]|uniref:uncharacterized protein LOC114523069 n=1 Tax=Dendronephthya gigantea TaxID=151771 RepID=UPI0010697DB9|nr:uncharacterized protein LOC114523069 [Dendronephthya gigantea]
MLYRNSSDAVDDMEGMVAFLNKTELDSILPRRCDDVIEKLRQSGFLWKFPPKFRTDHIKFVVSKCNENLTEMSGDELVNHGHLVAWLDPDQLDEIPGKLFVENLEDFRDNLEEQQRHKGFRRLIRNITKKIIDHLGGASALTADLIAQLGVLRKGLDKDDIKKMNSEALDALQLYEDDLDKDTAKQLFKSREERVTSRRKRADPDTRLQDVDFFLISGQTILGLPASDIAKIQGSVFEDIVGSVSQISGWEQDQLDKWAEKAKDVWGAANTFKTDELLLLNNFVKGFSASELNSMDLSSDDVINSFGQVTGYSAEKAQQLFAKIKTNTLVSAMTGADLLRLGTIAHGMTADDITKINENAFREALSQLGKMTGWSNEQLMELKNKAVAVYGETSSWEGVVLSTVNVIIGGFNDKEVKALEAEDLQYISTEAIAALPPNKFNQLSADLIRQLDGEQAQSVTDEQISQLTVEQKNALTSAQYGDGDGGDDGGTITKANKNTQNPTTNGTSTPIKETPDSGSTEVVFGLISLLLPFLCSQSFI